MGCLKKLDLPVDPCVHGIVFVILLAFVTVGGVILGIGGIPALKDYLREKEHHLGSTCTVKNINTKGQRECTYNVREKDYPGDESEDFRVIQSFYTCLYVKVSYKYPNGTILQAELFRTVHDAKLTDFECSAYECRYASDIFEYKNDLEEAQSFGCHFHPDEPQYVYKDSANVASIVLYFVFGILLIIIPIAIISIWLLCKFCY